MYFLRRFNQLNIAIIAILVLLSSCIQKNKIDITLKRKSSKTLNITVTNVQLVNHQIILTGTSLNTITTFTIVEGLNNYNMQIESQSATSLIANTTSNVTWAAGNAFNFILANATGTFPFTVDFSLCSSSLGGKGFNCTLIPTDKDVLAYDAVSGKWKPKSVSGSSYLGVWDASTALPTATTVGDYYIVSVANGAYGVGDWIVYNGTTFDQIVNSTTINSVFGRAGAVTATKGDYTLTQMGDVDLTTTPPLTNDILIYDGTNWVPNTISAGGGGTVTNMSGTAPFSVATGTTTPVISMTAATTAVNGYLTAADWNTFNNKQASITAGTNAQYYRGDKTFQTLDTSVVSENTNLYYTNARVLGAVLTGFDNTLAGVIAGTDTILQGFGKTQKQINDLSTTNGSFLLKNAADTLSGAVSLTSVITAGVTGDLILNSVPLTMTSAVNKTYADTADALKLSKTGDTMSGLLTLDADVKLKGGANYTTVKANAATAAYDFVLPSTAGTSGYVLKTDGAGNLSWINPAGVTAGSGTVDSTGIVDGAIMNVDINAAAAIDQSKIANLTTDLAAKQSTSLANGKILVGNAGGVATAVSMSGDTTIDNTGAVALKATGTAGTYTSVTTDAQGRVTAGTNPTVVTSVTVTAPVTVGGTAAVPLIGMPAATTAVNGYLTSTDWNTFNNKQAAITSASTLTTGSITTSLQGGVVVDPYGVAATNTGEVRLSELAANGANYVAFKSPDALAANVTYTLPATQGTSGQVLTTDGTASTPTLSWVTPTAAPVTSVNGATGVVVLSTTDIAEGTKLYYTDAREIAAPLTGFAAGANSTVLSTDTVLGAFQKVQGQLTATEPTITAGTTAQYLRGDKSLATFATDALAAVLTGLSTATNAVIAATDSVLVAFGELQAQVSGNSTSISSKADTTNVTQAITALKVTGLAAPVAGSDAVNKTYVDAFIQWSRGVGANANDVYFSTGNIAINSIAPGTKLEIDGPEVSGKGQIYIKADAGENGFYAVDVDAAKESGLMITKAGGGVDKEWWLYAGVSGNFDIAQSAAGPTWPEHFVVEKGGNVGIGTIAPGAKLEVTGQVKITGGTPGAGKILISDAIGVGSWNSSPYPITATLWWDESTVVVGSTLFHYNNTDQNYGYLAEQDPPADGDTLTQGFYLKAGTYTMNLLGYTITNRGKVDWYIDNVLVESGQDWYSAAGTANVEKSVNVTIVGDGYHVLKSVINGKNASSTDYSLSLTRIYFK